jgi:integrase
MDLQRKAADSGGPHQKITTKAASMTYEEAVEYYAKRHLMPNTRSGKLARSGLLHPSVKHLSNCLIGDITKADIIDVIDGLMEGGQPQSAVSMLRRMKTLFNWLRDRDLVPANPCDRIRPPAKTVERDRVLNDNEIASVWKASFELSPPYGEMYRMFLLTGQRRSEVSTMQWAEVTSDVWTIPREKVKKDRSHAVPLSKTAVATLASLGTLPRFEGGDYVFSTTGGLSASSNFAKVKLQMDKLSGVAGWTIHDIRRTVRSKLAELGVPREVARKILNHEDGKVDRIYNRHEYLAEKRKALEKWERKLLKL